MHPRSAYTARNECFLHTSYIYTPVSYIRTAMSAFCTHHLSLFPYSNIKVYASHWVLCVHLNILYRRTSNFVCAHHSITLILPQLSAYCIPSVVYIMHTLKWELLHTSTLYTLYLHFSDFVVGFIFVFFVCVRVRLRFKLLAQLWIDYSRYYESLARQEASCKACWNTVVNVLAALASDCTTNRWLHRFPLFTGNAVDAKSLLFLSF